MGEYFSLFERNRSWKKCYPKYSKANLFLNTDLLNDEFIKLYLTLFENATYYISIINALGRRWKGLTRQEIQEIAEETTLIDGENLNRYFDELLHFHSVSVKNLGIYLETISSYQKRTVEQ